jgi:hypothetical protein
MQDLTRHRGARIHVHAAASAAWVADVGDGGGCKAFMPRLNFADIAVFPMN